MDVWTNLSEDLVPVEGWSPSADHHLVVRECCVAVQDQRHDVIRARGPAPETHAAARRCLVNPARQRSTSTARSSGHARLPSSGSRAGCTGIPSSTGSRTRAAAVRDSRRAIWSRSYDPSLTSPARPTHATRSPAPDAAGHPGSLTPVYARAVPLPRQPPSVPPPGQCPPPPPTSIRPTSGQSQRNRLPDQLHSRVQLQPDLLPSHLARLPEPPILPCLDWTSLTAAFPSKLTKNFGMLLLVSRHSAHRERTHTPAQRQGLGTGNCAGDRCRCSRSLDPCGPVIAPAS